MEYNIQYYSGSDLIYPEKPKKPSLGRNPTPGQARAYADELEAYERKLKRYKDNMDAVRMVKQDRLSELKCVLRDGYNITVEQTNILWERAWDQGHDNGLGLVVDLFDEFYEMASAFAAMEKVD